jgi:PAS domain S-box-containing protein
VGLTLDEKETARREDLQSYRILDTPPEQCFDDLARLACYICGTPIGLISFFDLDRQWFKARVGWDLQEIPRAISFCAHTLQQNNVLVVSDTLKELESFKTLPLATHGGMRFYAGVPLISQAGYSLGTLCVMDSVPRALTEEQTCGLRQLAGQVMTQLELRRQLLGLQRLTEEDSSLQARGGSEANDSYALATEYSPDAILITDERNNILFANRATLKIFGVQKEEVVGHQVALLMPAYSRQMELQITKRYVETQSTNVSLEGIELRGRHKSGREVIVEISLSECLWGAKRVFIGVCRDITERKQREEDRARLAALVACSEEMIISNDLNGIITSWNKGAERLYGYSAEEAIGRPVSILVSEPASHEIAAIMNSLKRGKQVDNYGTVRVTKDGRCLDISLTISPIRDDAGKIVGFSTVAHEITQLKQTQEALRESERRLQGIIGSAMDAIITVDTNQRIVVFNKSAEEIFHCSASEALGQLLEKFIPERFRASHRQHVQKFSNTGVTARSMYSPGTLFGIRADGEEFPIEATISQVNDNTEKLLTVILRDIGARVRMEAELRHAQKMEAVGQLAGGVAHEFNNFLGVILGYTELLTHEEGQSEVLRRNLAEIKAATQHAASLTRQLLMFSRKQVSQTEVLDLNQSVWEGHKLLRRLVPANIDIVPVLAPAAAWVKVDAGQVQQVLINLVINARDAMPEGGKIVIEISNIEIDTASASQHGDLPAGSYVDLSISDTGCGMNEEALGHIFEPFYTTKGPGKGTGLGLSTVYGIVKQSGGQITVQSATGKGTIFRIYLPKAQTELIKPENAIVRDARSGISGTILIVEDDTALRRLLCVCLENHHYDIVTAKDGTEALESFQRDPARFQLVLSDLMMPRMDGLELKKRIAALNPEMRFLFMSGYAEEILENDEKGWTRCGFLQKPFLPGELLNQVETLLAEDSAA